MTVKSTHNCNGGGKEHNRLKIIEIFDRITNVSHTSHWYKLGINFETKYNITKYNII